MASDSLDTALDEDRLIRFEQAWIDGRPIQIEECLPDEADRGYLPLLIELVEVDLEFAWKQVRGHSGEDSSDTETVYTPCDVQGYLERFPRLKAPDVHERLARQEFYVRTRYGDRPPPADYRRRYPGVDWDAEAARAAPSERPTVSELLWPDDLVDRYRLVEEAGRGGFGAVWKADDPKLGREIAVKQLSDRLAAQPDARRRFVAEARVTARLEHPGVVPVYDLGSLEGDRPFYTMKLVRGRTLADAVAVFHEQHHDGTDVRIERLKLLNVFLSVARTMEYAHAHGVVHRDLKPQNIILGDYGETIILDWGLAKTLGQADPSALAADADTVQQAARSHGATPPRDLRVDETQPGMVQGTPAYMSPEQASGRTDDVGPASDVYSLGAVLYQVLTGALPFGGDSTADVLRRVREDSPAMPRSIRRDVPKPLQAVCLKAMAKDPDGRYASVEGLREDIERFLADEPVSVLAEPLHVRAGRLVRRHRTLVSSAIAGLAVAVVGLSLGVGLLSAANHRERDARERADENARAAIAARNDATRNLTDAVEQRNRARTNYNLAKGAVDRYLVLVTGDPLLKSHGFERLRRLLLAEAQKFYESLAKARSDDPKLKSDRADALIRLGEILRELGDVPTALEQVERAVEMLEQVVASDNSSEHRRELADAYNNRATILFQMNRFDEAESGYAAAEKIADALVAADSTSIDDRFRRIQLKTNRGVLEMQRGQVDAALASFRESIEALEPLAGAMHAIAAHRRSLGTTLLNLNKLLMQKGEWAEAERAARRAVRVFEELLRDEPDDADVHRGLERAQHNLGLMLRQQDRLDDAAAMYRKAIATCRQLVKRHPNVPAFLHDLAGSESNLAVVFINKSDYGAALPLLESAAKRRQLVAEMDPTNPDYAFEHSGVLLNLGVVLQSLNRSDDADARYAAAASVRRELVERYPQTVAYRKGLGDILRVRFGLARKRNDDDAAEKLIADAIHELEQAHRQARGNMLVLRSYIHGLVERADFYSARKRYREAAADYGRAREVTPEDQQSQPTLSQAKLLCRAGDYDAGIAIAKDLGSDPKNRGDRLVSAADVYAFAAALIVQDKSLAEKVRTAKSAEYAQASIAVLRKMHGLKLNPRLLAITMRRAEFRGLANRDDFRKLLRDVDAAAK